MDITLVVFDRKAFDLSSNLTAGVEQYIDENYVDDRHIEEYGTSYHSREKGNSAGPERRRRSVFERLSFPKRQSGRPVPGTSSEYGTGGSAPHSWGQREEFPEKPLQHAESLQDVSSPYTENRKGYRPSITGGLQARSLQDVISQAGETFQESLLRMIDERGLNDTQVYKRANIDRRLFSKIRSNREYSPKRQTAVSLALALELNMDETRDLLGRAGIALSCSSKFDLIISYCIQNGIYDIIRINAILFDYGQPLLGA